MKKLLVFLLILFFLLGCQSIFTPDDGDTFSPPNWIKGTWSNDNDLTVFEFTENNIILSPADLFDIDFLEFYSDNVIIQNKNLNEYEIAIEDSEGTHIVTYRFEKTSSTTLNYYRQTGSITIGPSVLTKEVE